MVKGIQYPDPVERLALLEILGQKKSASGSLSSRNDQRVPPREPKPVLDRPCETEAIRIRQWAPALEITDVVASCSPLESRTKLLRHGHVVLRQDLLAQSARFGSPQMREPLRRARLLFRLRRVAGIDENVGVNEREGDRAAPRVKGSCLTASSGRASAP